MCCPRPPRIRASPVAVARRPRRVEPRPPWAPAAAPRCAWHTSCGIPKRGSEGSWQRILEKGSRAATGRDSRRRLRRRGVAASANTGGASRVEVAGGGCQTRQRGLLGGSGRQRTSCERPLESCDGDSDGRDGLRMLLHRCWYLLRWW
jgi:hypothetical protein